MTSDEEVTVPGKRVSTRKTREVLRLYFELKLGQRQIARSANVSQSTVHEYLTRFTAAGLSWPLSTEMSEAELEAALFPTEPSPGSVATMLTSSFSNVLAKPPGVRKWTR